MTEVAQAIETPVVETPTAAAPIVDPASILSTEVAPPVIEPKPAVNLQDLLNADLKEVKSLQGFKDVNELAKSYTHQSSLLGKRVNDWAAEDVAGLYGKMGRPESTEGYIVPDELGDIKEPFLKDAFDAGLTQAQAKVFADRMIERNRSNEAEVNKNISNMDAEWAAEVRREFGSAYDSRMELAKRAVTTLAPEGFKKLLADTGLDKNPEVIKMFSSLGKNFLIGDRIVAGDRDGVFGITPQEAKRRIDQKMADVEFKRAYFSATHKEHASAVKEVNELYALLG